MQTRAPLGLSPESSTDFLFQVNGDGNAQVSDLPIEEATPNGAFTGTAEGFITMNLGATVSDDDPVWEEDATSGGIRLKLT